MRVGVQKELKQAIQFRLTPLNRVILMCGITAIFNYNKSAPPIDRKELRAIRDHMKLRGPDGKGEWYSDNNRVGLAHRRLAIIDLSDKAAQPMTSKDGKLIIIFNGEIYNYQALRQELEKKGCQFHSNSDTEVLLHLYADKGQSMVYDLRGMFTFIIWDKHKQGMLLARDHFGIKPLYYADDGKVIRIASQVKALLAGGKIESELEPAGQAGFFLWGHVPEPFTLYKNIRALEPGNTLWIDQHGNHSKKQFCSIRDELTKAYKTKQILTKEETHQNLREALLDSVRAHLVADVPVGIFLSSGLDSTTIVALAAEAGADLRTVTLGFKEYRGTHHDEVPLAEEVAKYYGASHQTIWITKDDFRREYSTLLNAMDQPTFDGINTYFVSMAAKKAGLKVALSGLGGDELFGGYPSFSQIPKSVNAFGWANSYPVLGKTLRSLSAPIISRISSPKYASLFEYGGSVSGAYLLRRSLYMPWELPQVMDKDTAAKGLGKLQTIPALNNTIADIPSDHLKISALEMTWYMRNQLLRDSDWASMAHSLEIRVPLVDLRLLNATAPLLENFGMSGKQAMALTPLKSLPDTIVNREKTGFTVPVREWLSGQDNNKHERGLRGWAQQLYLEFCH